MKAFTYVNGVMTVHRDGQKYSLETEKPEFVTGSAFYYEPTLKMQDGDELEEEQKSQALAYINDFVFPTPVSVPAPKLKSVHQVTAHGEYVTFAPLIEGNYEVPEAPIGNDKIWSFEQEAYYKAVLIDQNGKAGGAAGPYRLSELPGFSYAPATLYEGIEPTIQSWDGKVWVVDMVLAKERAYQQLKRLLYAELGSESDLEFVPGIEFATWLQQEQEALAFDADVNVSTPMLDQLLLGRNKGESKAEFSTKVINKAQRFRESLNTIGKYQRLRGEISSANTPHDILDVLAAAGA